jgi:hypothetical protein
MFMDFVVLLGRENNLLIEDGKLQITHKQNMCRLANTTIMENMDGST